MLYPETLIITIPPRPRKRPGESEDNMPKYKVIGYYEEYEEEVEAEDENEAVRKASPTLGDGYPYRYDVEEIKEVEEEVEEDDD